MALATAAAVNAPNSSWPSIAMLITPDRSHMQPASAPRISGMDAVKVPCSRLMTLTAWTSCPRPPSTAGRPGSTSRAPAMLSRRPSGPGVDDAARTTPRRDRDRAEHVDVAARRAARMSGSCDLAPGSDSAKVASPRWANRPNTTMSIRPSTMKVAGGQVPAAHRDRHAAPGLARAVTRSTPWRRRPAGRRRRPRRSRKMRRDQRRRRDEQHDQALDHRRRCRPALPVLPPA